MKGARENPGGWEGSVNKWPRVEENASRTRPRVPTSAMRRSSAIICAILSVLVNRFSEIEAGGPESREDTFCHPFPGVTLEGSRIGRFENGSLLHDNLLYPSGTYRVLGDQTYACVCDLRACLKKCCRRNEILGESDRPNCTVLSGTLAAPDLALEKDQLATEIQGISGMSDLFVLVEDMTCPEGTFKYMLEPERYEEDAFVLEANGTLRTMSDTFPAWAYCLDWKESFERIVAIVCLSADASADEDAEAQHESFKFGIIVSVPFFLATFLVYAIIPELRNLYGKTLMCYVACLILAYTFLVLAKLFYFQLILCTAIAFIIHFSFLASFFWLNVMCFDIWWTFGGFRSLQGSVKQRERKKFLIYSVYAWGCASLLTGVCAIMDFHPDIPKHFIKPELGTRRCWFTTDKAKAIYFYGPMGVTVFCNICLFVSTSLKIVQHKKDTAHHLKGADSRRHDDNNRQWFNLYLKLFIVMGINWSMEIISWLCNNKPAFIWYLTDLTNTLQGVIIFLIFVWKENIRRLLMKRFGCHESNVLSRNSTRSACHSSAASRTCTTTATQLHEKTVHHSNESSGSRTTFDNIDSQ